MHAKTALSLIVIQFVITILAGLFAFCVAGSSVAVSAVAGGTICLFSTVVFSLRVFAGRFEFEPGRFLRRLYIAEVQKIFFIVLLFIAAIKWIPLHHAGLLLGFVVVTLVSWLVLPLAIAYITDKAKSQKNI